MEESTKSSGGDPKPPEPDKPPAAPADPIRTQEVGLQFGPVRYHVKTSGRIQPRVSPLNALGADKLNERRDQIRVEREESDAALAKLVGRGFTALMIGQVVAIDAGFFWYAAENNWKISASVMVAWLGAGTVQVVGSVALVVARHLFPGKDADPPGGNAPTAG
jgi:hypothetical protein